MIAGVTQKNISDAGMVYCQSWRESHRDICSKEFLKSHDIEYQTRYLQDKLLNGWELFILYNDIQANGIVGLHCATGEIGLLYVLPAEWHKGYGRELLDFAVHKMSLNIQPFLYVLNTNRRAIRIYETYGFLYSGEQRILSRERGISELKYNYPIAKDNKYK
jgi:Acetyltransferases